MRQAQDDSILILIRTEIESAEDIQDQLEADFEEAKNDPNIDPEIRKKLTIDVQNIAINPVWKYYEITANDLGTGFFFLISGVRLFSA